MLVLRAGVEWFEVKSGAPHSEAAISVEHLNAILDEIHGQRAKSEPVLAVVTRSNGDTLAVGLGTPLFVDSSGATVDFTPPWPMSVLNFVAKDLDPPYFSSVGDATFPWLFVFYFNGHWSEFPARKAVPFGTAREAISSFVQMNTGLPTVVAWEQD